MKPDSPIDGESEFAFRFNLDRKGRIASFDFDFTSIETAVLDAKSQIVKVSIDVIKDKEGEARSLAIIEEGYRVVVSNLDNSVPSINKLIKLWPTVESYGDKMLVWQKVSKFNPSISVFLMALKKVYGEISASESLFVTFPGLLTIEQVSRIRAISRNVATILQDRTRAEVNASPKLRERSKRDREAFYEQYDRRIRDAIGNYIPYKIVVELNSLYLTQDFREEQLERIESLPKGDADLSSVSKIGKVILTEFKSEQLRLFKEDPDNYVFPVKFSA